ncbi:MAG TPA: CAP domain-containing protein [Bacillales bacterium]|nr:CAP domain-containing protein [Bacillales bacterium]
MLKKIAITAVLATALSIAGFQANSAHAADYHGQTNVHVYKYYHSSNGKDAGFSNQWWETYVKDYLHRHMDWEKCIPSPGKSPKQDPSPTQPQPVPQPSPGGSDDQQQNDQLNKYEQQVIVLTNQERTKRGLKPLKTDVDLSKMARDKSRDMAVHHYFAHNSPTYGSPFDMMKAYGISYNYAGENIAKGQRSPEEVVNAWMNSKGHRENILNPHYTHIGVGYISEGNIWSQEFTG